MTKKTNDGVVLIDYADKLKNYGQSPEKLRRVLVGEDPPEMDFPEEVPADEMGIWARELQLTGWHVERGVLGFSIRWPNQGIKHRIWVYKKRGEVYKLQPLPKIITTTQQRKL